MRRLDAKWWGILVVVIAIGVGLLTTVIPVGEIFPWSLALGTGVMAATASLALTLYRDRRDPELLLIGIGAAAFAVHVLMVPAKIDFLRSLHLTDAGQGNALGLLSLAPAAATLALLGTLAAVVPWRERRGRPPLRPRTVVLAVGGGLVLFDALVLLFDPRTPIRDPLSDPSVTPFAAAVLVITLACAAVVSVRSLARGGRSGWVAGAGLALAFVGATSLISFQSLRRDDLYVVWQVWNAIMPTVAGALLLVTVLATMRTEASRMRRATDRAAQVMDGRAEIASTIAHDVRGPVGTIKGLATTTRKSYERLGDAERQEFIWMIEQESTRLLHLVDQVAVALKIDAGSLETTQRLQPIEPLIAQLIRDLDGTDHPINLDDRAPGVEASVDTRWFVDAVRQGLENAMGFSPAGSPIHVIIENVDERTCAVRVQDQGPGIPPELRETMFEKFSRWRPQGYEERQGSGLGLFICRGIARAHGGDASLDGAPGGGTMLRIVLPREG